MERTIASDGYYLITKNGKRVREHRAVMEQILDRPLDRNEHVHHINCNKLDNVPTNLYLCSREEHAKIHASLERVIKTLMEAGVVKFSKGAYKPAEGIAVGHVLAE
jgi:HNH endonuclease